MEPIGPIALEDIEAARERIASAAVRTPLVRLDVDGPGEIWLKLECLQPIGSFKIRGAANAMALAGADALARGVYTASAGNMAQGVAFNATRLGIPCHVVVPEHAPATKLEAIARLGAAAIPVPCERWWSVIREHGYPGLDGLFIHPVSDPAVIAGNGTIGLEILEELPDVDAVVVPYGGGGLSCGIASAVKALCPTTRVYAAEVETAAPLAASLEAGVPASVERTPSFVDGIGGEGVLPEMWPLAHRLLDGAIVVTLAEIAEAIRLLAARARVVAEGAGGAAVAAALTDAVRPLAEDGAEGRGARVVAVVSGGNIDLEVLAEILRGGVPAAG